MSDTNIPVSDEVWTELNRRKNRGDTFDDVLRRVLSLNGSEEARPNASEATSRQTTAPVTVPSDIPERIDPEDAEAAIAAATEYLREHGPASMREIVAEVMPKHPLGYELPELEEGQRYRGAWWRRVVRPGLKGDERVAKPGPGRSDWRWTGAEY